jgi:glycosidase
MLWDDIKRRPESHTPRGRCQSLPGAPDKRLFKFYQRAIDLRKAHAVLRRGGLRWLETSSERLLAYARSDGRSEIIVLLNASDKPLSWTLESPAVDLWKSRKVRPGEMAVEPRGWRILSVGV